MKKTTKPQQITPSSYQWDADAKIEFTGKDFEILQNYFSLQIDKVSGKPVTDYQIHIFLNEAAKVMSKVLQEHVDKKVIKVV